jgi:hypothetical protein
MLRPARAAARSTSRDERGAVAIMSGVVAMALLMVGALVIDLGMTWATRGRLQLQADKAALLAAKTALPVTDSASRLKAARYVAWYIACNPVPGQSELDPGIPTCPSGTGPSSSSIATYAQQLLTAGAVSFPKSTEIRVEAPDARVDYTFGKAAGVDGSTQSKIAIATVASPGQLVPAGLSVPCLLSTGGNVPNGGDTLTRILPINYITPGPLTGTPTTTTWPASYDTAPSNAPVLSQVVTTPSPVVAGSTPASFTLTGSNWGSLSLLSSVQVYFHKGPDTGSPVPAVSLNLPVVDALTGTGTVTGVLPDQVMQNAGTWEVKISVQDALGNRLWSNALTLDVTPPATMSEAVGCGRLLDSPRTGAATTTEALQKNFQLGIDHPIVQHPNLANVTLPGLTPDDAVAAASDPTSIFTCSGSPPDVLDVPSPSGTPNCVRVAGNDASVGTAFTEGMLGAESGGVAGRLVCSSTHPCTGPTTTVRGVTINDDTFDRFVTNPTLLNDRLFYGLSTYITNGVPILTPDTGLSTDIYKSHRFMWVPVMSSPATPTSGSDYPVLTFRPVFITQDQASGWTSYDMLFDQLNALLGSLGIAQSDVQHGLLMSADGQTLLAMRFMTIEPASLPLVTDDYDGPTTDYLGVGPKLVKLVK